MRQHCYNNMFLIFLILLILHALSNSFCGIDALGASQYLHTNQQAAIDTSEHIKFEIQYPRNGQTRTKGDWNEIKPYFGTAFDSYKAVFDLLLERQKTIPDNNWTFVTDRNDLQEAEFINAKKANDISTENVKHIYGFIDNIPDTDCRVIIVIHKRWQKFTCYIETLSHTGLITNGPVSFLKELM